jgi:hypothetical protein
LGGEPPLRRRASEDSGKTNANSASDKSLEQRPRITSYFAYFARSAAFHGIANLQKSLQTPENQA